jgi:threonyl-tRNA synthetase
MMIIGEEDQAAGTVSFRYRNGDQKNGIQISAAISEVMAAIKNRSKI